jgi:ribonucleoside-diphosphate reductase alpha chain
VETAVLEKQQEKAANTAAKYSQETTVDVEPMSAEEMKALIQQAKEAEGDDCLMCGS